jgi:hypothetical protein
MLIERRIPDHKWLDYSAEDRHSVKQICSDYASEWGWCLEWDYIWIRFTPENLVLANIKYPDITRILHG